MRRWTRYQPVGAALVVLSLLTGCADGEPAAQPQPARTSPAASPATSASATPGTAPSTAPSASAEPPFTGTAAAVTAADVPRSWRAGCPVGPQQLSRLTLTHWGFDGTAHVGTLIVHRSVAAGLITVFETLYRERFPIRLIQPVDAYDGSDDASMAADNTSAFNCRRAVAAGAPTWSEHAYGKAIDVNPVENPYVFGGKVLPPAGAAHLDRSGAKPGYAVTGGVLVKAFAAAGWKWGGARTSNPDYQHFSTSGN
jgi:hypothetical protein